MTFTGGFRSHLLASIYVLRRKTFPASQVDRNFEDGRALHLLPSRVACLELVKIITHIFKSNLLWMNLHQSFCQIKVGTISQAGKSQMLEIVLE